VLCEQTVPEAPSAERTVDVGVASHVTTHNAESLNQGLVSGGP